MNTNIIKQLFEKSLAGEITFPEVIMGLSQNGIERYSVDLVALQKITYGTDANFHCDSFSLEKIPNIPQSLDAVSVKSAITDSQQGKITYLVFLERIMQAGCCYYEVYIRGKKVIYSGRDGSQHIELFPSKP